MKRIVLMVVAIAGIAGSGFAENNGQGTAAGALGQAERMASGGLDRGYDNAAWRGPGADASPLAAAAAARAHLPPASGAQARAAEKSAVARPSRGEGSDPRVTAALAGMILGAAMFTGAFIASVAMFGGVATGPVLAVAVAGFILMGVSPLAAMFWPKKDGK